LRAGCRSLAALRAAPQLVALQAAWWLFKVLLSVAAVACGAWIAYDWGSSGVPGALIPALVVFCAGLLIAAAPWVLGYQKHTPPRTQSLVAIAAGVITLSLAVGYINSPYVLRNCERRSLGCDFFNWLHGLAGNWAVVGVMMAIAALFIGGGAYMLVKTLRS
jgi:hypothetical protein